VKQYEIERVAKLADLPMSTLRIAAFDGGEVQPSQHEADERFRGWSRGSLIAHILNGENLDSTDWKENPMWRESQIETLRALKKAAMASLPNPYQLNADGSYVWADKVKELCKFLDLPEPTDIEFCYGVEASYQEYKKSFW
jgi:hypothetical protein